LTACSELETNGFNELQGAHLVLELNVFSFSFVAVLHENFSKMVNKTERLRRKRKKKSIKLINLIDCIMLRTKHQVISLTSIVAKLIITQYII
jgi:hypothetical protein